jgi:hypothetical protein
MGILIQFPQPGTRIPLGELPSSQSNGSEGRHAAAYRRDLDRAVALLLEHVDSDAYDGVALILKPKLPAYKPALVVGGFYRHKLTEAAEATMRLHLAIKLRAREQESAPKENDTHRCSQSATSKPSEVIDNDMQNTLQQKWIDATSRYHHCEQMLRIAFSKQLRASSETTALMLGITQLHIETVANCLGELVRQPGRATPQAKLDTLNAIQLFRTVRAQVSAWMPPAGQEEMYFTANATALSEDMLGRAIYLLADVEQSLAKVLQNPLDERSDVLATS